MPSPLARIALRTRPSPDPVNSTHPLQEPSAPGRDGMSTPVVDMSAHQLPYCGRDIMWEPKERNVGSDKAQGRQQRGSMTLAGFQREVGPGQVEKVGKRTLD